MTRADITRVKIPAAFVLGILPRVYSGLTGPGKKFFDPQNPRNFKERLEKADGLDKKVRETPPLPRPTGFFRQRRAPCDRRQPGGGGD